MSRPFMGCHGSFEPDQVEAVRQAASQTDLHDLYREWCPGLDAELYERGEFHEFWLNTVPEVREFYGREDRNAWVREIAKGLPGAEFYRVWDDLFDRTRASVRDELRLRFRGHKLRLAASPDDCELLTTLNCWRADAPTRSLREPVSSPRQCVELILRFTS